MEVPKQHAYDELGIPMPSDGEDTLSPDDLYQARTSPQEAPEDKREAYPSDEDSTDPEQASELGEADEGPSEDERD